MKRPFALLLALGLAAVLTTGCVTLPDPEASQEFSGHTIGMVEGTQAVGQTLVARRPRLTGVELWLSAPEGAGATSLVFELFHAPGDEQPLVSQPVAVTGADPTRISFSPQKGPPGQNYYVHLRAAGGVVRVGGRNADAYPGGRAFVDGAPADADLAFRLYYDYDAGAMLGDLAGLLPRPWLALPLAALLLLPGWLLLDLLDLHEPFDSGQRAALAVGLSLAVVALLLLWTSTVGLRLGRPTVVVGALLLATLAAWRLLRRLIQARKRLPAPAPGNPSTTYNLPSTIWTTWPLAAIFVVSLLVRLAMVRDLAAPAWVDSVHHALLARLIVEGGALPETYAPFVTVDTASYHAGFHSVLAAFHWLSGLDLPGAMLLLGQVLNALAVPAAYLLAADLTRDRGVGLVAALVTGLFSPMPAYYASWGRYTQLAGLLILPAAFVLLRRGLDERVSGTPRYLALSALALAGLVLTHNRVTVFCAALLLAYLAGQRYGRATRPQHLAADGLRLGLVAGGVLALTLPWIVPALTTLWLPKLGAWTGADPRAFQDFSWRYLTGARGEYVLVLGALGWLWALVRRQRFALTLGLWVGLLFVLASLGVWGLPGGGFINYVSVEISLFLPLSVLCGYVVTEVLAAWRAALSPRWQAAYRWGASLLLAGATIYGGWAMLPLLNADTVLYRQADGPALRWIEANTPPDAVFLINPMPWSAYMYAGADGGYWIGPLAGRRTVPPSLLYGLGPPAEIAAVNELSAAVLASGHDPEALWPALRAEGVTHVYVGARGGPLSAQALAQSLGYRLLFNQRGVWVFALNGVDP